MISISKWCDTPISSITMSQKSVPCPPNYISGVWQSINFAGKIPSFIAPVHTVITWEENLPPCKVIVGFSKQILMTLSMWSPFFSPKFLLMYRKRLQSSRWQTNNSSRCSAAWEREIETCQQGYGRFPITKHWSNSSKSGCRKSVSYRSVRKKIFPYKELIGICEAKPPLRMSWFSCSSPVVISTANVVLFICAIFSKGDPVSSCLVLPKSNFMDTPKMSIFNLMFAQADANGLHRCTPQNALEDLPKTNV